MEVALKKLNGSTGLCQDMLDETTAENRDKNVAINEWVDLKIPCTICDDSETEGGY